MYHWDGENRLVMVEPVNVSDGVKQVTNTYDYLGRRVRKLTEVYNASTPAYEVESDVRYVYDGWNVVLELDGLLEELIHKKYTWGLDLSNSLQGAGGVGGLLACHDTRATVSTGDDVDYLYQYDGNGNVVALTNSANGNTLKKYDYDPYGNAVAIGLQGFMIPDVSDNPYRFSTKPLDEATGLYYYGYRYYSAGLGRWVSRDPIGELGGENIYSFVLNSSPSKIDYLGMSDCDGKDGEVTMKEYLDFIEEVWKESGYLADDQERYSNAKKWGKRLEYFDDMIAYLTVPDPEFRKKMQDKYAAILTEKALKKAAEKAFGSFAGTFLIGFNAGKMLGKPIGAHLSKQLEHFANEEICATCTAKAKGDGDKTTIAPPKLYKAKTRHGEEFECFSTEEGATQAHCRCGNRRFFVKMRKNSGNIIQTVLEAARICEPETEWKECGCSGKEEEAWMLGDGAVYFGG